MSDPQDAGRVIGMVSNQIKRQLDEFTSRSTLTGMQGRFLHFILAKYGESTETEVFQRDLEEEFNLRRSTATGILQLMEKNGLLYRESVAYDARLKKIVITEKGMRMREQVVENFRVLEERLQCGISPEDLAVFFRVMERMSKNLE